MCYTVLPNFQVMFLSDALTQDHLIPIGYVFRTLIYGRAVHRRGAAGDVSLPESRGGVSNEPREIRTLTNAEYRAIIALRAVCLI